jgi:hypothetical protein
MIEVPHAGASRPGTIRPIKSYRIPVLSIPPIPPLTPSLPHSMLTQLSTIKSRLQLLETDPTYDLLLTAAIKAVSARFDKESNRTLARTVGATEEFSADDTEVIPACYPIESVTRFETKSSESTGWLEQPGLQFVIHRSCVISLASPLCIPQSALHISRVTYTGGYVLPGTPPGPGQVALPDDLEQAAVEQLAYWFQKRDKLGLRINWPSGATYQQFLDPDLLQSVSAVLKHYQRWTV